LRLSKWSWLNSDSHHPSLHLAPRYSSSAVPSDTSAPPESRAEKFLREVGALKEKMGGVDDFSPSPVDLLAQTVHF
jgi:hypothetical protein